MAAAPRRVAHRLTFDARDGSISIEGVKLPYYLRNVHSIENLEGLVGCVTVEIYADNIELVSKEGETSRPVTGSLQSDLDWARREAGNIVREGMADVLEWLWTGTTAALEKIPTRYVLGLDEDERRALASRTTHSEDGQETGDKA